MRCGSHNLEHRYAREVFLALREFYRVLKQKGVTYLFLPDIQVVAEELMIGNLEGILCHSPSVPVSPIGVFWGYRKAIQAGNWLIRQVLLPKQLLKNSWLQALDKHLFNEEENRSIYLLLLKKVPRGNHGSISSVISDVSIGFTTSSSGAITTSSSALPTNLTKRPSSQ